MADSWCRAASCPRRCGLYVAPAESVGSVWRPCVVCGHSVHVHRVVSYRTVKR